MHKRAQNEWKAAIGCPRQPAKAKTVRNEMLAQYTLMSVTDMAQAEYFYQSRTCRLRQPLGPERAGSTPCRILADKLFRSVLLWVQHERAMQEAWGAAFSVLRLVLPGEWREHLRVLVQTMQPFVHVHIEHFPQVHSEWLRIKAASVSQ